MQPEWPRSRSDQLAVPHRSSTSSTAGAHAGGLVDPCVSDAELGQIGSEFEPQGEDDAEQQQQQAHSDGRKHARDEGQRLLGERHSREGKRARVEAAAQPRELEGAACMARMAAVVAQVDAYGSMPGQTVGDCGKVLSSSSSSKIRHAILLIPEGCVAQGRVSGAALEAKEKLRGLAPAEGVGVLAWLVDSLSQHVHPAGRVHVRLPYHPCLSNCVCHVLFAR